MNSVTSLRILPADADSSPLQPAGDAGSGFRDVLDSAIGDMQQLGGQAEARVAGVLEGTGDDVHSAMIAVEKADLSFQLMLQVRNKIVSAYEEISRMQF
jgi:flagellar hook-basal body complex protein FliE